MGLGSRSSSLSGPAKLLPSLGFSFLMHRSLGWEGTPKVKTSISVYPILFGGFVDKTRSHFVSFCVGFLKGHLLLNIKNKCFSYLLECVLKVSNTCIIIRNKIPCFD